MKQLLVKSSFGRPKMKAVALGTSSRQSRAKFYQPPRVLTGFGGLTHPSLTKKKCITNRVSLTSSKHFDDSFEEHIESGRLA